MFCPRCGSSQNDELKFCTVCGVNLLSVRHAVEAPETGEKTDRGNWFATIAADAESHRRKEELDHQRGITAEIKRYNEIKGGVITASVGLAFAIFVDVFMHGLVLSGKVGPDVAEILTRLWIAGLIPMFIGVALIVNGMFISKRLAKIVREAAQLNPGLPEKDTNPLALRSAETTEFIPTNFSVSEGTTKHLRTSDSKR